MSEAAKKLHHESQVADGLYFFTEDSYDFLCPPYGYGTVPSDLNELKAFIASRREDDLPVFKPMRDHLTLQGFLKEDVAYRLVCIWHPLANLISQTWLPVLVMVLCTTGIEWGIIAMMRKRKQTKGSGSVLSSTLMTGFVHELKTPLAVMGALVLGLYR